MEISALVIASISLIGFATGFMMGTLYALNVLRKAVEGTKHVKR